MRYGLKAAYAIVVAVLVVMQAIGMTGLINTPIEHLASRFRGEYAAANLGFVLAWVVVLELFSRPSRRELLWMLCIGAASIPLFWITVPQPWERVPAWSWATAAVSGFGLAGVAAIALRLRDPLRDADATRALLAACPLVPLAAAAAACSLDLTAALHPATLDRHLYRFDATLGFEPSAAVAMVFQMIPPLEVAATFAYVALRYGISAVFAFQVARRLDTPASVLLV